MMRRGHKSMHTCKTHIKYFMENPRLEDGDGEQITETDEGQPMKEYSSEEI
jgi:hypothetical protein